MIGSLLNVEKNLSAIADFKCLLRNSCMRKVLFLEVIARQLSKRQKMTELIWFANIKAFTETGF